MFFSRNWRHRHYAEIRVFIFYEVAYLVRKGGRGCGAGKAIRKITLLDRRARSTIVFSVQLFQLNLRADQIKKFFFHAQFG